jgi:hypothetical protein
MIRPLSTFRVENSQTCARHYLTIWSAFFNSNYF